MDKAFEFIKSLPQGFFSIFGFPTIRVCSDYCEVKFKTFGFIRSVDLLLKYSPGDFRMFAESDGSIVLVFTFNC